MTRLLIPSLIHIQSRGKMSCSRCGRIMYPNGSTAKKQFNSENHRKGVCSDGFPSRLKEFKYENGTEDTILEVPWPQLEGIFKNGKTFNPLIFLITVRFMYERVIIAEKPETLSLEYDSLAQVCSDRCIMDDNGVVFFRTFPQLDIISHPAVADALVVHEGMKYVRIDALRDA